MTSPLHHRTTLLLGSDAMTRLQSTRIILFGVGGVGGWCAEALIRSGVGHLTIVDSDCVAPTNINRQIMAMGSTIGQPKVEVLRRRLLDINPEADVLAIQRIFSEETADDFPLDDYDYVVDAIDSLSDKALLITRATRSKARLFASMGAALKCDPTQIAVAEFMQVKGCPLARALRNRFKRTNQYPRRKFKCVYSPELLANHPEAVDNTTESGMAQAGSTPKAQVNGSLAHITGIFGFTLAGLIINDIYHATCQNNSSLPQEQKTINTPCS